jgi:hypothetical protein
VRQGSITIESASGGSFGESVRLAGIAQVGDTLRWQARSAGFVGFALLTLPTTEVPTAFRGYYTATLDLELDDEDGAIVEVWAGGELRGSYTGPSKWQFLDAHIFHLGVIDRADVEVRVLGATSVAHVLNLELVEQGGGFQEVLELYVAGGEVAGMAIASSRRYLTTGDVEPLADMPGPRSAAGVFVLDGKMYVAGGTTTTDSTQSTSLFRYTPDSDAWETLASMATARRQMAAAVYGTDGFVFGGATGSSRLDSCERYDTLTDAWSAVTAMPLGARNHHRAAVLDGKIYVLAGQDPTNAALARVEVLDPVAGTWDTTKAPLSTARVAPQVGVYDGRIFVCARAWPARSRRRSTTPSPTRGRPAQRCRARPPTGATGRSVGTSWSSRRAERPTRST